MSEVAKEAPKQALKTMFCNTDLSSASIWVVKPGQEVKTHMHPNSDDIWIIIEGEGDFHPEVGKNMSLKRLLLLGSIALYVLDTWNSTISCHLARIMNHLI